MRDSSLTLILSLMLLPGIQFSQEAPSPYRLLQSLPVEARFFTTDKLQQVYLVTPGNEVVKFSPDGQELFRYSNNTLGVLAHIDATNPFHLLLYYPEYQTAITLDRTLNKLEEFNLWNLDVVDIKGIAMAGDNGLWLYDNGTYTLKKIDQHGEVLRRSDNLSLLLGTTPAPDKLVARANFIYANDPALGLLVFDLFGQYVRTLSLPGITDFQVLDQRILYQQDGQYFIYNLRSFTEKPLPLPEGKGEALQVRMERDLLYVLRGGTVVIFQIQ
jgi:hypothetical protein